MGFTPEVPAVTTSSPAEYTCKLPVYFCGANGEEQYTNQPACTGKKATKAACEALSNDCKGVLTKPEVKQTPKIVAACVKRQCAEVAFFGKGGCELLGCKFTAGSAQVGTLASKCIADAALTNTNKKNACAAANVAQCGMTANGGQACCKAGPSSDYKAAGVNTCTAKTTTAKTTTAKTTTTAIPILNGDEKCCNGMMMTISLATMIVMAVMMS